MISSLMNCIRSVVTSSVLLLAITTVAQNAEKKDEVCYNPNLVKDTTRKSIKSAVVGVIGADSIKINYHSPGVRGRIIWGGLVPFDDVWVTGAHDATTITFDKPIIIANKTIVPGKYALFTIPGRNEWTIIINSHWKQHLTSEYDAKDDVVRFNVKPLIIPHLERLQYFIEPRDNKSVTIAIAWEKMRIEFPLVFKTD